MPIARSLPSVRSAACFVDFERPVGRKVIESSARELGAGSQSRMPSGRVCVEEGAGGDGKQWQVGESRQPKQQHLTFTTDMHLQKHRRAHFGIGGHGSV